MQRKGSLVIVGSGIKAVGQFTLEAMSHIQNAEEVLYLVADPVSEHWIRSQNSRCESLVSFYQEGKRRIETYEAMKERLLSSVRAGKSVCSVFYGHPNVFVYPSRIAVEQARREGFDAFILPGISAEDCLFADLCVDPAANGCLSYEATYFLIHGKLPDISSALILWQIGAIGDPLYSPKRRDLVGLQILRDMLLSHYPAEHNVCLYEAAQYVVCPPRIKWVPLSHMADEPVSGITTLFVPPIPTAKRLNREVLGKLGLQLESGENRFAPVEAVKAS